MSTPDAVDPARERRPPRSRTAGPRAGRGSSADDVGAAEAAGEGAGAGAGAVSIGSELGEAAPASIGPPCANAIAGASATEIPSVTTIASARGRRITLRAYPRRPRRLTMQLLVPVQ